MPWSVKYQWRRHRQDVLPGKRILAGKALHPPAVQRPADLRGFRRQANGLAPAGNVDAPVFIQKLQFNGVCVLKILGVKHCVAVILVVADHDIGVEIAHAGASLTLQGGAGVAVKIGHQDHRGQRSNEQQNDNNGQNTPHDPSPAHTNQPAFPFWGRPACLLRLVQHYASHLYPYPQTVVM